MGRVNAMWMARQENAGDIIEQMRAALEFAEPYLQDYASQNHDDDEYGGCVDHAVELVAKAIALGE